ncbi:MAG: hypothetical protein IPJ51_05970 [Saprospiraceae bacterium]|nr:hypothetical protein [Saprospiraceae bacterium]
MIQTELFWMGGPSGILIYDNINNRFNETEISQAVNKIIMDLKIVYGLDFK